MLKTKICVQEFVQGPQTLCLFEPNKSLIHCNRLLCFMKTPAGWDERCRQNQQSQAIQIEIKGVQRRTQQHKSLSLWRGCLPCGDMLLRKVSLTSRSSRNLGSCSLLRISRWLGHSILQLFPFKSLFCLFYAKYMKLIWNIT